MTRRRWLIAAAVFAGWTLLALFFASQDAVIYLRPGAGDVPPFSVFVVVSRARIVK